MTNQLKPYEKSGIIYDRMLNHVDYVDWAEYILEIINYHSPNVKSVLDLACGTGSFLKELSKYSFKLSGLEQSSTMISFAEKKLGNDINLIQADMLTYKAKNQFDLITCLFDSINYTDSLKKLELLINNTSENIKDDGIFIFDAVSRKACKHYFGNYTETDIIDDVEYERYCYYDLDSNTQISEFTFNVNGNTYYEKHIQYIYSYEEILKTIEKSKMKVIAAYSDFSLFDLDRETERAHFVLQKGNHDE